MLVKEIVYQVLDEIRVNSDDSYFTEDHVLNLLNAYRLLFLKDSLRKNDQIISDANYQELCIDLEEVPAIEGIPCEGGHYLRSTKTIPQLSKFGVVMIYPIDYYTHSPLTFVSREKMRYAGHNPRLSNIIYASIAPNRYLYLKSCNPQFLYLRKLKFVAVFNDFRDAAKLACENNCDIMEQEFPLDASLIPTVIMSITNELIRPMHQLTEDKTNDAQDKVLTQRIPGNYNETQSQISGQ